MVLSVERLRFEYDDTQRKLERARSDLAQANVWQAEAEEYWQAKVAEHPRSDWENARPADDTKSFAWRVSEFESELDDIRDIMRRRMA